VSFPHGCGSALPRRDAGFRSNAVGSQLLLQHGMGLKVFLMFSVRMRSYLHSCGLRENSQHETKVKNRHFLCVPPVRSPSVLEAYVK